MKLTVRRNSVACLLMIGCLTVCLVGADREYSPPVGRQQGHPRSSSSSSSSSSDDQDSSLSQLLNDSKLSQLLDDPDLWLILKKRFGEGGGPMAPSPTAPDDECWADRRRNSTIIKTKDSLEAGAQFIVAPTVTSYRECEDQCCKEKNCNAAIVNLKDSKNGGIQCYLFDCKSPSVCIFTAHPGFVVLEFGSDNSPEHHADELDQLALSSFNVVSSVMPTSLTTTSTTTTTTTTTTATTKAKALEKEFSAVGLFSLCHRSSDCRDQNTDCLANHCICKQGFHVVEQKCRKDCDQELEFECANKNSPLFSECIAVYDYCDGIPQCTDGSDETSCLDSSRHKESKGTEAKLQSELTELSNGEQDSERKAVEGESERRTKIKHLYPSDALPSKIESDDLIDGGTKVSGIERTSSYEVENHQRLSPSETGKDASEETVSHTHSDDQVPPNYDPYPDQSRADRLKHHDKSVQVKQTDTQRSKVKEHGQPKEQTDGGSQQRFDSRGHDGASYTDQLLSYGSLSGSGKKYVADDSHSLQHNKPSVNDKSFAGNAKYGFHSTNDGQEMDRSPAHSGDVDQIPDDRRVNEGVERKHKPDDREKPTASAPFKNKHAKEGNFGRAEEMDSNSYGAQNYVKGDESRNGLDESSGGVQGSRISSKDVYHYPHVHYDNQNINLDKTKDDLYRHPIDQPILGSPYMNVAQGQSDSGGGRLSGLPTGNGDQTAEHHSADSVMPRRPVNGAAGDARRHKTPVDYTPQELEIPKSHQQGFYDAGEHLMPERFNYERPGSKLGSILPDQGEYDRSGSRSGDLLHEHSGFDQTGAEPTNMLPGYAHYDETGSKSADVYSEKDGFDKQRSTSKAVSQDGGRRTRPGSKPLEALPPHVGYNQVNSKSVAEHGAYDRQGVKTADHEAEHNGYEMSLSKLAQSRGKGRLFHNKDRGYNGGGPIYGAYDSGNYEDEVGNPNYAMWLKAEDQSNDPGGFVDPRQAMSESPDGYDRGDGYMGHLQPDGTGDIYAPDYIQYYYGGNNPGLPKSGRNYIRNGDYDYGGSQIGRGQEKVGHQPPDVNNSTVAVRTEPPPSVVSSKVESVAPVVGSTKTVLPPEATSQAGAKSTVAVKISSTQHRDVLSVDEKQTSAEHSGDVKQEKLEPNFWKMETNRGAIVALVLGIILTTTLLILAGCRLRHFRKRYRKGRHLNSNEADYLINGMYL